MSLLKSDRSFDVEQGQTVLDAALDAGLNLPHSCKGGNCGACRARLIEGEVSYPNGRPLGLSDSETADGLILLCQARALGDLAIETFEAGTPDEIQVKRLPCRVECTLRLSQDVMGLYLRLPAAERFDFKAGQYVDVLLSKGRRRSFSIASPPHDSALLELHVRRVEGGEFTDRVFGDGLKGALLTVEGPLGHFFYREAGAGTAGEPMLLVGGGTGLAPLKSMIRHVIENDLPREMTLYWGVRAQSDLYAHAELEEICRRDARLRYVPVLSEASASWTGRKGFVHAAVLDDIERLEPYETYAAGPPEMVEAVRREFSLRGARSSNLSFDSFDYAPDSAARHRSTAVTKS